MYICHMVLGTGQTKIKALPIWCLMRTHLVGYRQLFSCFNLTWPKKAKMLSGFSFLRVLIPSMRTPPSWPSLAQSSTSRHCYIRDWASTYEFGGDINIQYIATCKISQTLLRIFWYSVIQSIKKNFFTIKCFGFIIAMYLFLTTLRNMFWFFRIIYLVLSYRFTWTKDDKPFDLSDSRIIVSNNSGTFKIPNEGHVSHFQGKYRCFASNKLGVAMSEEIEFIVPSKCYNGGFILQTF